MSARWFSLVVGGSTTPSERCEVALSVPESGPVHFHFYLGGKAGPAEEIAKRSLSGWSGLIVGVGLMTAFAGGYQIGHRPAPDDVSNLRPMPALGGLVPPEPAMPSAAALGLPAIQRQLAMPPQIIPPPRAPERSSPVAPAPSAAGAAVNRNAFGLEN